MSRGEVGDTLRYFEAGQMEAVMSRGNSRKLTRGQSSNSLKPGARGGKGLNPEALFSVAAMATVRILCLNFSLNPLRFFLTRLIGTKISRAKS